MVFTSYFLHIRAAVNPIFRPVLRVIALTNLRENVLDADIEKTVKSCNVCQVMRNNPNEAPVHPYPTAPWLRLHINFKGPVKGRMYLVVVDANYDSTCYYQSITGNFQSTRSTRSLFRTMVPSSHQKGLVHSAKTMEYFIEDQHLTNLPQMDKLKELSRFLNLPQIKQYLLEKTLTLLLHNKCLSIKTLLILLQENHLLCYL